MEGKIGAQASLKRWLIFDREASWERMPMDEDREEEGDKAEAFTN